MPVLRAAQSAEELALLRTVVADLSDTAALSVYTDWLEEHRDARGPFLREFLRAFAAREPLPAVPEGISPAWADVLALPVRRRLRVPIEAADRSMQRHLRKKHPQGLAAYEPHFDDLLRGTVAAVRLVVGAPMPMAELPLATTRAGGVPDLPVGVTWPYWEEKGSWPMQFLFQVDLADLHGTLADGLLPGSGLLSVFHSPVHPGPQRMFYFAEGAEWYRPALPQPYNWRPGWRGDQDFPSAHARLLDLVDSLRFGRLETTERLEPPDWYLREGYDRGPKQHWLCSTWKQGMRWEWDGGPTGSRKHHVKLVELDCEDDLEWHFGDGDSLHLFATPEDARAGRFDRIISDEI